MGSSSPDNDGGAVPNEDTAGVGGAPASSSGERPERTGSFFGLRHWRLRSKLAAVLIIPTLTALALGALRVVDDAGQAGQFQQTADQVGFAVKITTVVHELQGERALAIGRVSSQDSLRQTGLDAQIAKVDRVVDDLRNSAGTVTTDDQATKDRYSQGLQRLDALRPLRGAISSSSYSDVAVLNTYSSILDSLIQLGQEVTTAVTNRDVLRLGTSTQAISRAKEFYARGDASLQIAAFRGSFPGDLLDQTRAAQASGDAAIASFLASATIDQRQLYSDTYSGPEIDDRRRIQTSAFALAQLAQAPNVDAAVLGKDSGLATDRLRAVETNLLTSLRTRADDLATAAINSAWIGAAIVLLALAAALGLMLFVARLMLLPLRILRSTALQVAYTRLPETVQAILDDPDPVRASKRAIEPVPITSRDEFGEVARSFDVVHEQAIRMAAEQALLRENVNGIFVNLSRRSQRLVERQLGVIDRLEADEQDPDHLASLFELDHLATRLRRNGESLLVLSGAGLAKSVPKPVPAGDVIGAAVSEIEQYARIEVGMVPDVAVQGLTIHDLVHVLAELLDNATYFSEPETKVTVRAVITRKKALAIQVTDHGVGMTEERLAEVNQRLADPPDLDVSVTRRMGLYVVARLAQRHGIEVRLRENEDIEGGVIARVLVPAELLTPMRTAAPRNTPPPVNRAETSMPSMPPIERQLENPTPPPPPKQPEPQVGGLVPLDQPISLDDLVGGSNHAFLSPPRSIPDTPAWPTAEDLAPSNGSGSGSGNGNGNGNGDGASSHSDTQFAPLVLPKREPKYVPVTPDEPSRHEVGGSGASALDDDVPTRRLPIYQSVLSRWFSEGDEAASGGAAETLAAYAEPESVSEPFPEPEAVETPEAFPTAEPVETAQPVAEEEHHNGAHEEGLLDKPKVSMDDGWYSASDNGWQAAQALLETKSEVITPAGLPKRVPNAYLVPGSVSGGEKQDAFADATAGLPGTGAITRSATAARSRMASFQRGYKSGRHALKEHTDEDGPPEGEGVPVSGGGSAYRSSGRSHADDSSEE
ncbi:sensor histidine kinase [Amycolatopsis sp. H20-H5]|uniref:sensor histidine kinase n=1 Tax=Amycolatopsis sp. H20-H5 TaxID=3046309 RepID=UPI002DBF4960|nr:nitrate- and nitrite sensing domain-containing protein [Amycolatopsis sp. H20-H5]MEC3978553.1 nitrate- and nitrite sensing domain-containing protein [Amycolatopsis sp. H20-H5]